MYAVVVEVDTSGAERDTALQGLRERVVPSVKQAPGFQTGIWLAPDDASRGMGVIVLDSEDNANALAETIGAGDGPQPGVTVESVRVREVGATA